MRTVILSAILCIGFAACEGTGDRTHQADEPERTPEMNRTDTTSTSSQSTYHTDSVTGQGAAYDTSNTNNKGNTTTPGSNASEGSNTGQESKP